MTENSAKVVVQIVPSLESGGVERGVIDIAKALKNNGFKPMVISAGGVLVFELKEAKIEHIQLDVKSKNPLKIFKNIKILKEILTNYQVDILHVRSRAPMWSAYWACKNTKTKLITTVHGTYSLNFLWWKIFPLKKFYNAIMLKSHAIIAVSDYIKNYIAQNYGENFAKNTTVIHRGADLNHFNPAKTSNIRIIDLIKKWNLPEDKKIILMPGRFTAWKGHEFLIAALRLVKNDFFCVMLGSDHGHQKYRRKIEEKIIENNLADKIRIIGATKEMSTAYQIAHFVVAPSVRPEAFGRIAIESQASAKIIVTTNIGGALETVIDGKTGFLVKPYDAEGLALIIDKILEMPKDQADKIGKAGRQNIEENFSNNLMCQKTLDLYNLNLNL